MNGIEMKRARRQLGLMWGLGRGLSLAELARACRLSGERPSTVVRDYERGKTKISGPLSALIDCYLRGVLPSDPLDEIITPNDEYEDDPDD
ncbi:helix-turn-helix transcriptional regulator [Phenylobacterium sp.]|uniref:helix-turn-helix domain-containing protein n=1 Tax=Phenylobacterium sp. TaxID=1871053 RepID=UPI0026105FF1|nr:helix-turn-helix transcriptional regulator [Phenylobacterium sp.]